MARKKGHSYGGFWVFGFFLWLPAVIVAACLKDKSAQQNNYYAPPQYQPPYGAPMPPPPYVAPAPPPPVRPAQPEPRVCAYCGTQSAADKQYCSSCGANLKQ
jgi:hypothetical protein